MPSCVGRMNAMKTGASQGLCEVRISVAELRRWQATARVRSPKPPIRRTTCMSSPRLLRGQSDSGGQPVDAATPDGTRSEPPDGRMRAGQSRV
jgi:hypothetical protein